ncbi:MAG: T9SS type A sorting domain-containing protein [candidate division WOR-3 bacterium]|nr:MAG: T9SS type A sorting domain-containing protein [candidate division WOR-3 bacterium]
MVARYLVAFLCSISCTLYAQETGARYLIITHDDFYEAIEPLARWKTQKGLKTRIAALSETGSDSTEIRSYIMNAYNTWQPRPEYVLFVGSKYHITFPYFQIAGYVVSSDNYYVNVTGDFRNEMIPGRFWANDTLQVQTIVQKVLSYEKNPTLEDSFWLIKGTTIVNEDNYPPYDDSTYWADARYAHSLMIEAGFAHIDSFSEYRGHNSIDVLNAINDGRSYILYRGGGLQVWDWPFWDIDTNYMFNGYKLPIVISATCATIEGIGQQWLTAGTPEDTKGVVGFLGTTTALYHAAQFRSALARGTLESIFHDRTSTLGKAAEAGRLNYYQLFGDQLEYHSWNCLGDPEMTLRTMIPQPMNAVINSELSTGICTVFMHVTCNAVPIESALVCIMAELDTSFYHVGYTDADGVIQFMDTLYVPVDTVYFTASKYNTIPFQSWRHVNFSGGPYLILTSVSQSDSIGGNGDDVINPGEEIEMSAWIRNTGDVTAHDVTGMIRPAVVDTFYALIDSTSVFGDIARYDSAYSVDAFDIAIANNCPDSHEVLLELTIADSSGQQWVDTISLMCRAPFLDLHDFYFPGFLKYTTAGDTNQLFVELINSGSYNAENVSATLLCDDSFYTSIDSVAVFGTINSGEVGSNNTNPFIITSHEQIPLCYPVECMLAISSGVYTDTMPFTFYVGAKDYMVWDPDPNHSSGPILYQILDDLGFTGEYVTDFPAGLASLNRSIFICCGVYPENFVIVDTSDAAMALETYITLQDGRLYLEGGDVWVADPQAFYGYDFCPYFGIEPVSNTIGLFPAVIGQSGAFTQGMEFVYDGEFTMLDYIDSIIGSSLIFENTYNDHGCGVAANNRTVGFSFELGCLVDTVPPSTRQILLDSIMDYFGIVPTGIEEHKTSESIMSPYMHITPNPGRHTVRFIIYGLSSSTPSCIYIYDICGRLVRDIAIPAATAQPVIVLWDGKDINGRAVAQGVYIAFLSTSDKTLKEKIILLK